MFLLLFFSIGNLPFQNFQLSIVNFSIKEGQAIKSMIEVVGGHVIEEVTFKTDIIISLK